MNFYLMPSIEFGPIVIKRLLEQISQDRLDEAIHPDRFTPREVIAHLADWEPIMRARLQAAVSQPGSPIQAHDEGQMALDHGYAKTHSAEQAEVFRKERHATAEYLRTLAPEDWKGHAKHPERGVQTVEDLANLLLGHDLYHIEQLSEYLK